MSAVLGLLLVAALVAGVPTAEAPGGRATPTAKSCREIVDDLAREHREAWLIEVGDRRVLQLRAAGEFLPDTMVLLTVGGPDFAARAFAAPSELCEQLRRLRRSDPGIDQQTASKKLVFSAVSLNSLQLARLRELSINLPRLQATVGDSIYLPNRNIDFWLSSGAEELRVCVNVPDPGAEGVAYSGDLAPSQPELAEWSEKLLRIVRRADDMRSPR